MEECDLTEPSDDFGFDAANFWRQVNLYRYRESVGISKMTLVMTQVIDLEECEVMGRC